MIATGDRVLVLGDAHPRGGHGVVEHVSSAGPLCVVLYDCGCREHVVARRLRPSGAPPAPRPEVAAVHRPRLGPSWGADGSYLAPAAAGAIPSRGTSDARARREQRACAPEDLPMTRPVSARNRRVLAALPGTMAEVAAAVPELPRRQVGKVVAHLKLLGFLTSTELPRVPGRGGSPPHRYALTAKGEAELGRVGA